MNSMDKILIIGACGQLGIELTLKLREKYGNDAVIASDLYEKPANLIKDGHYVKLDIMEKGNFHKLLKKYAINQIYHLVAMLSAKAEQNPYNAWQLNMESLLLVLEAGKEQVKKIYWPSSIAVFGPDTPKQNTPQHTIMNPNTVYGISKLAGERWCEYYAKKYGVDIRSLRYPGLIGYKAMPNGGTTDYAVDIFHKAMNGLPYTCFLSENTRLPMMYMEDAVNATVHLMETDVANVKIRDSYNLAAISFSPKELLLEINKYYPDFKVTYTPDFRQKIAASWPESIDDNAARNDWGWQHSYDLKKLVKTMIAHLNPS